MEARSDGALTCTQTIEAAVIGRRPTFCLHPVAPFPATNVAPANRPPFH